MNKAQLKALKTFANGSVWNLIKKLLKEKASNLEVDYTKEVKEIGLEVLANKKAEEVIDKLIKELDQLKNINLNKKDWV